MAAIRATYLGSLVYLRFLLTDFDEIKNVYDILNNGEFKYHKRKPPKSNKKPLNTDFTGFHWHSIDAIYIQYNIVEYDNESVQIAI